MKKAPLLLALAVALVALPAVSAHVDASWHGCESSDGRAKGCSPGGVSGNPVSVPEPGSLALLAVGLAVVVLARKRMAEN
jgi:hypothetical protein